MFFYPIEKRMIAILLLFIALAASAPVGPLNYPPSFPHKAPRIKQRAPQIPSPGTLGEQPRLPQPNERGYTTVISPIIDEINWNNLIEDDDISPYLPQYAREDALLISSLSSSSHVKLDPSEFLCG
jgi:predicted small lipoprotein YifL